MLTILLGVLAAIAPAECGSRAQAIVALHSAQARFKPGTPVARLRREQGEPAADPLLWDHRPYRAVPWRTVGADGHYHLVQFILCDFDSADRLLRCVPDGEPEH